MPDHPKFRVYCRCGRPHCPYRQRHRKDFIMADRPKLSNWSLGYLTTVAVVLVLAVLAGYGDVPVPWWASALAWAPMVLWTFLPMLPRPARWRVTDDRRPSWADKDSDS